MNAVYNENDPFAAEWLRQLISMGEITDGTVIEKSITDLTADELRGYSEIHFFAGIGIFSRALRDSGIYDTRFAPSIENPFLTGSCPCQPFSTAQTTGKNFKESLADKRHLWPHMHRLIEEYNQINDYPIRHIAGEQVSQKKGQRWYYELVQPALEKEGYLTDAISLGAHSIHPSAHQRLRLYWAAHRWMENSAEIGRRKWADKNPHQQHGDSSAEIGHNRDGIRTVTGVVSASSGMANSPSKRNRGENGNSVGTESGANEIRHTGATSGMADNSRQGLQGRHVGISRHTGQREGENSQEIIDNREGTRDTIRENSICNALERPHTNNDHSTGTNKQIRYVYCTDLKWRPISTEPGDVPMVDADTKIMGRRGTISGYGNAVVLPLATEWIKTYVETLEEMYETRLPD